MGGNMDTLEMIYHSCLSSMLFETTIPSSVLKDVELIGKNCNKQKGVYTVLVTLLFQEDRLIQIMLHQY